MTLRNYTEKQFIEAIANSTSIRQALKKLNVVEAGGNYVTAKQLVKKLNLDTSHFLTRRNINLGKKLGPKRPLSDYLSNKFPIQSFKLKNRLLSEGLLKEACSNCNLSLWLDNPIPLELDHINGNNQDNSIVNLRLLCPNCHALTENYRGKNIRK